MGFFDLLFSNKPTSPSINNLTERLVHTTRCFMDASMFLVDSSGKIDTSQKQALVYAYAFGALDAVAQHNHADNDATLVATVFFFIEYFNMSPERAARATRLCVELSKNPNHAKYIHAGGQAILDWAIRRNTYAPLRLAKILDDFDAISPHN